MLTLSRSLARRALLARTGLGPRRDWSPAAIGTLLAERRAIQMDPLDPLGTNADLVAMARIRDLARGALYDEIYDHAFEHYAKERCFLPYDAFPYYAAEAPRRPDFRAGAYAKRLTPEILQAALTAIEERGPLCASELDLGKVEALNWNGWKGTSNAARMAFELLARRCVLVISGRRDREKRFDLPVRHLGAHGHPAPIDGEAFIEWAIMDRVRAAGLLSVRAGIWWSSITPRTAYARLIAQGRLVEVQVEGVRGALLAEPGVEEAARAYVPSDEMRLLGPLDPLLWNRPLVEALFGFRYLWEVYKPAADRRWGWYVMPLLHGERLVGRLEGKVQDTLMVIENIWSEGRGSIDRKALDALLGEHAVMCGCRHFERPTTFEVRP